MALITDLEPPHKRGQKTNKFIKTLEENKNHLASNIFNLFLSTRAWSRLLLNQMQKLASSTKPIFYWLKTYSPHFAISLVALVVVSTNFLVKYAKADTSISYAEPETEISFAKEADTFTPIIETDGQAVEKAYLASSEDFSSVTSSVATTITQREEPLPDNSNANVNYTIRDNDNLTTLSWKFDVNIATLMYVNDIENADLIKPGQSIKIPPRGYEVSAAAIAKKEADKKAKQLASAQKKTSTRTSSTASFGKVSHPAGSKYNGYPYGYCTYWVASKRAMPSSLGNAKNWLGSAARSGYSTGSTPAEGAVVVTTESWWGHVAYVESVDGDSITISEMNYAGWGVVSRRTISAYSGVVRGYIY